MARKQNNPNNGKFNQLLYNLCVKKTNNQFKKQDKENIRAITQGSFILFSAN